MSTNYSFEVRRIKELYFFINESAAGMPGNQPVKLEMGIYLTFNVPTNLLMLTIRAFYHFPDRPAQDVLLDIQVQNAFGIGGLDQFYKGETIKLPPELITAVVDLSVSHTRAVLAIKTAGTVFQDTLLAVLDAGDLAAHFFPAMFENDMPMEELIESVE
jgi:hypothetical protein